MHQSKNATHKILSTTSGIAKWTTSVLCPPVRGHFFLAGLFPPGLVLEALPEEGRDRVVLLLIQLEKSKGVKTKERKQACEQA